MFNSAVLYYFSPTGGTKKVGEAFCGALAGNTVPMDLGRKEGKPERRNDRKRRVRRSRNRARTRRRATRRRASSRRERAASNVERNGR